MMKELFEIFPYLENDKIIIKKMELSDVEALAQISNNDNIYRFIPPFLYRKSNKALETAIKNLGKRDFEKKKLIIAGIYLKDDPNRLIGLAEMFDYKKRENKITIGYKVNEDYWNKKIATNTLKLMVDYLVNEIGITTLNAFVMPNNIYSSKILLNNGFVKENYTIQEKNWGGQKLVSVDVYTYRTL
ncbi:GNAT family N-acetyltransferase [Clostridiaceae bacterium DONG20-135]|uniref:GNAT family N-acetyltransferase n=2 Tax=Copranaerobaculum intestinale TaxID=2692629 RepID=A0A6N8U7B1_9FIRM|nr:GNAT family N-acetyltransferase [Copranaerobaculum intestinale]